MIHRSSLLALALLAIAGAVHASDGVLEINQTCALNTGCFTGDTAGFPVQISASGSYILTGNLSATGAVSSLIEIGARDVTLDLNGFVIDGQGSCSGTPVTSCTGGLATYGISRTATDASAGARLRNGVVRGATSNGVHLSGDRIVIQDVQAVENGVTGLWLDGSSSIVARATAVSNGSNGIRVIGQNASITDSVAEFNQDEGIVAGNAATIENSASNQNGFSGIRTGNTSVVRGCSVRENGDLGIDVAQGSVVVDGVVRSSDFGITATSSLVVDNAVYSSDNNGILVDGASAVRGNVIHHANASDFALELFDTESIFTDNNIFTSGTTPGPTSGGTNAGGNYCNGALCP